MTKLIIDGREIEVPAEYTLLQACEEAGAEIPRFCFHERLSIAGNCRMCLVEVKGSPKPVASCAWGVRDCRPGPNGEAPQIFTKTPLVKAARNGVMEFLLINHPLDCPICDQGGECDLQDQAMAYGVAGSRYHENKRAVENKYIGPLVRTSMNRCIHCTRCVRFMAEVAGTGDMGAIGRGEDMEITSYLESALGSELQSCIADLCPVGALLPKPYPFKARPWEMTKTETIDVMDALGSAIRVDTRGREVLRILPRVNDAVNEEWISDKTRHVADGLKAQRLDRPYLRRDGRLVPVSWAEAFAAIAARIKATTPKRIGAIAGDLCSVEDMYALQMLMGRLGSVNIDCRQDGTVLHPRFGRASYLFNATVAGIEDATSLLIIGSNPRTESPVLNARIRKRWLKGNFPIEVIGPQVDLTVPYKYLGAGAETLGGLAGQGGSRGERPLIIVGQGALTRSDGGAILALAAKLVAGLEGVAEGLVWALDPAFRGLARRRSRPRFRAGGGGARCRRHGEAGRARCALPAGRRRDRHRARRVRRLPGHARRSRRASGRCDPAGGDLHRKSRALRQHGRSRSACRTLQFSAGRRARGLGGAACAFRCVGFTSPLRQLPRVACRPPRGASAFR